MIPAEKSNCSSKNFQAIANANLRMYTLCVEKEAPDDQTMQYLAVWQENKLYCEASERKEYNEKENTTWKTVSKDDPRKMWKTINYKDKNSQPKSNNSDISPEIVHRYFTAIFQAEHLAAKPTVDDIKEELNNYSVVHDYLDDDFSYDELNKAMV